MTTETDMNVLTTKIDLLVTAVNALAAGNIAAVGAGAAVSGASEVNAGAHTATGASLSEDTSKSRAGVDTRYAAAAVREDIGETEAQAANVVAVSSVTSALESKILAQSIAETDQRIRHTEEMFNNRSRLTISRDSQDVRATDVAGYANWYGKPPTGEQDSSVKA